jgi:starch phosphorylase
MVIRGGYLLPSIPDGLEPLIDLALDLHWSWNHTADRLWKYIDPVLWDRTGNPWLILQTVASTRLKALAADPDFRKLLDEVATGHNEAVDGITWFQQSYQKSPISVAYFCMEFGLTEGLPIYSGGLGILAGDYLKTASDLGIPVVGVGLLYHQGYFRQVVDSQGNQLEYYPHNDPNQLPIVPVREQNGEWLRVSVDLPGRQLWLRVWQAKVGRVKLFLLDSNDPVNTPPDRGITSELYGGEAELRLQQEIVLGIGGWRALIALGIPPNICHLNEGHAAFAAVERARSFMKSSGQSFYVSLAATRAGNIFTTHTPVEAGFDRFPPDMIDRYLRRYLNGIGLSLDRFLALGRQDPENTQEPLNMAYLAIRGSGIVNAVSSLHAEVSRRIFQPLFPRWSRAEVPITHVTNGVHTPSWDSVASDNLWSSACGKRRWLGTMETLIDDLNKVPDDTIWNFRLEQTKQLIRYARQRLAQQLAAIGAPEQQINRCDTILDPDILTMGFARRFTSYKRPNLLLHYSARLLRILNHPQYPVQLIIAGKAHPEDHEGKALVQEWSRFTRRPDARSRVIFIADYDIALAQQLVQGVDVWINTPRRPWEACGTSGMKVLVNGGLNLSEREGWWAEAYRPEVGWAIGDGQEHGDDPDWDAKEAEELYSVLEKEVIPCFYDRDDKGIPRAWVARMRNSMANLTPRFSTNRMLREYVERLYLPAFQNYQERSESGARKTIELCQWRESIQAHWAELHFGKLEIHEEAGHYHFRVPVFLGQLNPDAVAVQIYADPTANGQPEVHSLATGDIMAGSVNGYLYSARIPAQRPASDYTPRLIPYFKGIAVPLETAFILWYES